MRSAITKTISKRSFGIVYMVPTKGNGIGPGGKLEGNVTEFLPQYAGR